MSFARQALAFRKKPVLRAVKYAPDKAFFVTEGTCPTTIERVSRAELFAAYERYVRSELASDGEEEEEEAADEEEDEEAEAPKKKKAKTAGKAATKAAPKAPAPKAAAPKAAVVRPSAGRHVHDMLEPLKKANWKASNGTNVGKLHPLKKGVKVIRKFERSFLDIGLPPKEWREHQTKVKEERDAAALLLKNKRAEVEAKREARNAM